MNASLVNKKAKSIRHRLNREKSFKNENQEMVEKLLEWSDRDLSNLLSILSPVIGLYNHDFRRSHSLCLASKSKEVKKKEIIRALIFDTMNIIGMSPKTRELIVDASLNGYWLNRNRKKTETDSFYIYKVFLSLERILANKVMEKTQYKSINFKNLLDIYEDCKVNGGNVFEIMANSKLNHINREYVQDITNYAHIQANHVSKALNAYANINMQFSKSVIGRNGFLSKYSQEKIGKKKSYQQALSLAVFDMGVYAGMDVDIFEEIVHRHREKTKQEENAS